jgi:hypothetical protein
MPYQICTGHDPGWDSSPQYLIGVRLPRRVPVPIRGARTQAYQYAPQVKGAVMPEKPDSSAPPPRSGGVHRTYPVPTPVPTPAPKPVSKPASKPAPKEDAA